MKPPSPPAKRHFRRAATFSLVLGALLVSLSQAGWSFTPGAISLLPRWLQFGIVLLAAVGAVGEIFTVLPEIYERWFKPRAKRVDDFSCVNCHTKIIASQESCPNCGWTWRSEPRAEL